MTAAYGLSPRRIVALAIAALLLCTAPAIADERISARFEMFGFAGLRVLTLHSVTQESGDRYAITVNFATRGLASMFVDLTTFAQVRGRLVGGAVEPEHFRNDTLRNGAQRHSQVEYHPGGNIAGSSTPALSQPVAPAAMRGTIDNLTVYFRLERQLAATGHCAMTARVFDGRHGYDLVFADGGRATLSAVSRQDFAGQTIVCRMTRHNWASFPDPEKDEGARQGTIWYARLVRGDVMVPVRMRMETQLGTVEGYLAELHASGVNLQLME